MLFAVLGLFLAGFREGMWRRCTPEDVVRWRAEAETMPPAPPQAASGKPVHKAAWRAHLARASRHNQPS